VVLYISGRNLTVLLRLSEAEVHLYFAQGSTLYKPLLESSPLLYSLQGQLLKQKVPSDSLVRGASGSIRRLTDYQLSRDAAADNTRRVPQLCSPKPLTAATPRHGGARRDRTPNGSHE
jgi:hypothetical protein